MAPTIRHNGSMDYQVLMTLKGHDCPAEPKFNSVFQRWFCSSCEWEYEITENQCLICGHDERDSPVADESGQLREQFITFNHPMTGHQFGLHASCAIYGVVERVIDFASIPDEDDGEVA